MVSKAFGGSLGLLWGALGSLLGALSGLWIDQRRLPDSPWNCLGPRLIASCCRIWLAERTMSFFDSSRSLLGSILSSQTDHPTLQIVDFTMRILTFLKNQRFRSKDGFESVLGLSRAPFGSSWGSLGSFLGPLDRPKRASRFVLELSWAWFACFLLPKMALGTLWDVSGSFGASWGRF